MKEKHGETYLRMNGKRLPERSTNSPKVQHSKYVLWLFHHLKKQKPHGYVSIVFVSFSLVFIAQVKHLRADGSFFFFLCVCVGLGVAARLGQLQTANFRFIFRMHQQREQVHAKVEQMTK